MTKTDPSKTEVSKGTSKSTNVVTLPAKAVEQRPSEKVIAFVKRHPVITVAGGVAVGIAVSALLPRRATRLVPRRASRKLLEKAVDLAEVASAAGLVLGKQAGEKAHDVGVGARKQAYVFADKAEKASGIAVLNLEKYGLAAVAAASALGRATAKRASKLGDVAADAAHRLGDTAAERSAKVVDMAEDLKARAKSRH